MACRSDIQSFLNKSLSYTCAANGRTYTYTVAQYARWVSYQTWINGGRPGAVQVDVVLAQWGIETGWGTSTGFANKNLAGMTYTCDTAISRCGTWYGSSGQGFATFCNWRDSVKAYYQLLSNGYQHVAYAGYNGEAGQTGYKAAAIALGQGYRSAYQYQTDYCTSLRSVNSSNPRLWDTGRYNDGGGPGSKLYNVIAANSCLQIGFQTTDLGVYMC